MEVLVLLGHIPAFLSIFLTVQTWYFIYVNFLPFVGQLPYLKRVNPYKACLRIGYILLPWCEFLDVKIRVPESAEDEDIDLGDNEESQKSSSFDKAKDNLIDSDFDYAEEQFTAYRNFFVNLYRIVPFRSLSRLWGQVNSVEVPLFLRAPMYGLYARLFNCNLGEALVEDFKQYKNLQEFFMRELKPDVRPVDAHHTLVSPCDGRVLHFGKVEKSKLEQVKGVTYSLKEFLGPRSTIPADAVDGKYEVSDEDYHSSLCQKEGTSLYHCVIYLAPGDYHRFHSPTNWTAHHRRHFPGELLSVNPGIARWVRGLFNYNERVCITGEWQYGFFSLTAVGATNVGSIAFYCDQELCTNLTGKYKPGIYFDKSLKSCHKESIDHDGVVMTKGTGIGTFNLGSTIVLVFEAPKDFEFVFNSGDKIRLGERLGSL
ncbi:phosphatidylserine decarboxylase proenzyme, mitochondrial-like isoform X1 [Lytechinus variegatus]|uniref:phosphatidylserine decarboxylase proenzyme, mitochondrial-like isoform X1 n=1 Tax=Lytechinus variegatus TaxID=7654 RepID=UPI001BB20063|nr:phosphatidylserine decarboxylase proenzyme, mitochondrial-like isoform X1 [Lytechinus variegatus]